MILESLSKFAVMFLLAVSSFLNVSTFPKEDSQSWKQDTSFPANEFRKDSDGYFTAQFYSDDLSSQCQKSPKAILNFPPVLHGSHRIFLDGRLVASFGDETFQSAQSFWGTLLVPCRLLEGGQRIEWRVRSYSSYFSRFLYWPWIDIRQSNPNIFWEVLPLIAAGGLIVLALISIIVFWGKVQSTLGISLALSPLFFALHFISTVPYLVGLHFPMLTMHKFGDLCLWLGSIFFFRAFYDIKIFSKSYFYIYLGSVIFAIFFILVGLDGDTIQLGTTIPFVPFYITLGSSLFKLFRKFLSSGVRRNTAFQAISLCFFGFFTANDVFICLGIYSGPTTMSIGFLGGICFLVLNIADSVNETYRERDYLRQNLEREVVLKTSEIIEKSEEIKLILETVPQDILTIEGSDQKLKVGSNYPKILPKVLHTRSLNDLDVDVFLRVLGIEDEERSVVTSVLLSIIGEDEIAWECNFHNLPLTTQSCSGDVQNLFRLTWTPQYNNGFLYRVLVTVSDETELEGKRKEAANLENQLVIVGSMAKVNIQNLNAFIKNLSQEFEKVVSFLDAPHESDNFVNAKVILHTLKGEGRSFNFMPLTQAIHGFELSLRNDSNYKNSLENTKNTVQDYLRVYENFFSRMPDDDQIFVKEEDLRRAIIGQDTNQITSYIYKPSVNFISDLEVVRGISHQAKSVGKLVRIKVVEDLKQFIDIKFKKDFEAILVHLISNALEHGIEAPDERVLAKKNPQGEILVLIRNCEIWIEDDGRGLDLFALRSRANRKGKGDMGLSDYDLAMQIFEDEFTTNATPNLMSGMGMGLPAVVRIVRNLEGMVDIVLRETVGGRTKFSFKISIPGMIRFDNRGQ